MATQPPDFVTFRTPQPVEVRDERVPVYRVALELARCLYTVIELIEGVERVSLRYKLDQRSTAIPMAGSGRSTSTVRPTSPERVATSASPGSCT
jgi:hypothetical protein